MGFKNLFWQFFVMLQFVAIIKQTTDKDVDDLDFADVDLLLSNPAFIALLDQVIPSGKLGGPLKDTINALKAVAKIQAITGKRIDELDLSDLTALMANPDFVAMIMEMIPPPVVED